MRNLRASEDAGNGQNGCNACAIVGNSRTVEAAALLPYVQRCRCWKNGIDMSAEGDETAAVARANAKNIADLIDLNIDEAELAETIGQPGGAGGFSKRGRSNPRRLHLPERKLRFLGAEALKRGSNLQRAGEPRHFFGQRGIRIRGRHLRNKLHASAILQRARENNVRAKMSGEDGYSRFG